MHVKVMSPSKPRRLKRNRDFPADVPNDQDRTICLAVKTPQTTVTPAFSVNITRTGIFASPGDQLNDAINSAIVPVATGDERPKSKRLRDLICIETRASTKPNNAMAGQKPTIDSTYTNVPSAAAVAAPA
jgi:hypothetical protein